MNYSARYALLADFGEFDWNRLRVFRVAVEAGSFTRAGTLLGLSQSAVSRQIAGLEASLKISLFHRGAQGLALTEVGEIFHATVTSMFERLAMGLARIDDFRGAACGPLRIATAVVFGSSWLTSKMAKFRREFPDISPTLLLSDNIELDLSTRQADIAIRFFNQTQPNLIQRHLMALPFRVYASREYVARKGVPQTVADLDEHDLIAYGDYLPAHVHDLDWLVKVGIPADQPRPAVMRASSVYAILRAVKGGLGLGLLPAYLQEDLLDLVEVLEDTRKPVVEAFLVYPEEVRKSRRIEALTKFLMSEARDDFQPLRETAV
ncbi:LysR family transcriptional regulator [Chenggangzhangella methanolivorans]|uniref:LysR family transcriptional regulator n=1 Tax=Chenggangzhangella methanolivorans TaxID=1437009 RepID=A0A9E6R7Y9_9HYPH|nr:LysR family transcriptional regulator [Chenggangzhangella methanolivorans]QZN99126.1 LysR family transcriptional regulator [Chenggangzhangella methanolivorans]